MMQAVRRTLRSRKEWQFFAALPRADRALAVIWWAVLILRGVLPALFAIAMGALVTAVQRGDSLAGVLQRMWANATDFRWGKEVVA